jgi:hypothetical protein
LDGARCDRRYQCAGSKRKKAISESEGWHTSPFVAHPIAPPAVSCLYARPDVASDAENLRDQHLAMPARQQFARLLPAFELYESDIYRALVKQFGVATRTFSADGA